MDGPPSRGHTHTARITGFDVRYASNSAAEADMAKGSSGASCYLHTPLYVSLDDLIMRPFHCVLGRHALDRLRIHVRDDVFGHHFGGLAIGRPRISCQPTEWRDIAERQQDRIDFPYLGFLPIPGSAVGVTLLRGEPLPKNRFRVHPAQEILGRFLVLGVTHQHIGEGTWKVKLAARTH